MCTAPTAPLLALKKSSQETEEDLLNLAAPLQGCHCNPDLGQGVQDSTVGWLPVGLLAWSPQAVKSGWNADVFDEVWVWWMWFRLTWADSKGIKSLHVRGCSWPCLLYLRDWYKFYLWFLLLSFKVKKKTKQQNKSLCSMKRGFTYFI